MKRIVIALLLVVCCSVRAAGNRQEDRLLKYIQTKSDIREGGTNIYNYEGNTYVISVVPLVVGTKNEQNCKTVGSAKAKREMLSFINGSNITSYTELMAAETTVETKDGSEVVFQQDYVEYIKETVMGTINQCVPLCGWYSYDRSVYFYAIYRIVE